MNSIQLLLQQSLHQMMPLVSGMFSRSEYNYNSPKVPQQYLMMSPAFADFSLLCRNMCPYCYIICQMFMAFFFSQACRGRGGFGNKNWASELDRKYIGCPAIFYKLHSYFSSLLWCTQLIFLQKDLLIQRYEVFF